VSGFPRPLAELSSDQAKRLTGLVFDLDDTVLDHGALSEAAYSALFSLREAGLHLVACTGRPAGWSEVLLRQWPIDAAVAENGAVGLVKQPQHGGPARIETIFPTDREVARDQREELMHLARELVTRFPDADLADDNDARWTDVTIDIGEHRRASPEAVAAMLADATSRGVVTFVSSVHLHLSLNTEDKASGTLRLLEAGFGESREEACCTNAFVGDSSNDASAFSAFQTTFGVANVTKYLSSLPAPPIYVTENTMGTGFAELAARLVALRAGDLA
jgi:HAD superfamily hydrolase (TIGR01484 family)